MKNKFMLKLSRSVHTVGFAIQKKSPEILVGVGIVGAVASAVLACKATVKATKAAEEAHKQLDTINTAGETGQTASGEEYTEEDEKKDKIIVYTKTGIQFAKIYGPAVILGAASITSILASHHLMKKKNIALAAAYTAMDKAFKDYRGRVAERFGEAVEKELRYGIKAQEMETTVTDEDGKEKTVKETVPVAPAGFDPNKYSPYARIFDETHPSWHKDAEQNLYYLRIRQEQANDTLRARGHLFLNEVYDMLGFPRTKAGAVVGWVYDEDDPQGDNFVDFGLMDIRRQGACDFVNGFERAIILDFNCVGDILDQLATHQYL